MKYCYNIMCIKINILNEEKKTTMAYVLTIYYYLTNYY